MKKVSEKTLDSTKKLYKSLEREFKSSKIKEVITSDGRKSDSHEAAKKGSYIYLLYDSDDNLLYVGETGVSIRRRLTGDGSGSHQIKNNEMYRKIDTIKYIKTDCENGLSPKERKVIESALILCLNPAFNDK